MNNTYNHYKYLKYKYKYIQLKNLMGGNQSYEVSVSNPWFDFICNGQKTIEGRLNKGKFSQFVEGDYVIFINGNNKCKTEIVKIDKYPSFEEYLEDKGLARTIPTANDINEAINVYRQYYSREDEQKFGVLAIEVRLVN